jgi:hypothetical protein
MLIIKPISGKLNTKSDNVPKTIDPYLRLKYNKEWRYSGISKAADKYPYWNDSFSFTENSDISFLMVECWDYNIESRMDGTDIIGKGKAELKRNDFAGTSLIWSTLRLDGQVTGEILLEVEFIRTEDPQKKKNPPRVNMTKNQSGEENEYVVCLKNKANPGDFMTRRNPSRENATPLQTITNKINNIPQNDNSISALSSGRAAGSTSAALKKENDKTRKNNLSLNQRPPSTNKYGSFENLMPAYL